MKFEDLHDVEIGDILECKDLGAMFKVVDIDMAARHTPILVEMLSGYATTDLTTGLTNSCRFDESNKQWLYAKIEALRDRVPDYKAMIDRDYYDHNARIFEKFRAGGYSKAWDKSKFIR